MQEFNDTLTKTKKTEESYRTRAKLNIENFKKEMGVTTFSEEDASSFVDWTISKKASISKSYWRQRKAAGVFFLSELGFSDASNLLKETDSQGAYTYRTKKERETKGKTSATKAKKISVDDEKKIYAWLQKTYSSQWSKPTLLYLRATVLSGLRPCEWEGSEFNDNLADENGKELGCSLKVINAKSTNLRAHGKFRHIILSDMDKDDIEIIKGHMRSIKKHMNINGITFEKYQKEVSRRLSTAITKIWPSRKMKITLYSGRHQFSANYKAAGFSRAEIAALMGHATDETAGQHYGRKKAGRKTGGLVKALNSEVQKIRVMIGDGPSHSPRSKKSNFPRL